MIDINVSILHRFAMSKMYGKLSIFNSKFIAFFYISYFVRKISSENKLNNQIKMFNIEFDRSR